MAVTNQAQSTEDLAALAFSLLPLAAADVVNRRLSIAERKRLREGLSRMHNASDADRRAAVRLLASTVKQGVDWPRPASHDEHDCPFTPIASHPRFHVVDVLDRMAQRDPIEVVVTLCHLSATTRQDLWDRLSPRTRDIVLPRLQEVHLVSKIKTREYARDVNERLTRAIKSSGRRRA